MFKKLFYASATVLMLALAYHLGASTATAQAGAQVSGFSVDNGYAYVLTSNGDVYSRFTDGSTLSPTPVRLVGNFWGGATSAATQSFGALKAKYR